MYPTAEMDPGADLDHDVEVAPYSVIDPKVSIG